MLLVAVAGAASAASYEAELPEGIYNDPDLCKYAPCSSVLPGATRFGPREGSPAYVRGFHQDGNQEQLVGYVFLSSDVAPDIVGYSGKPMVTLVGMDAKGHISGVRILKHSEPILLAGIPEARLDEYVRQYLGNPAGTRFELGQAREGEVSMEVISGATVTVMAENQLVSRGSFAVARQVGLVEAVARPQARLLPYEGAPLDWAALVDDGSVRHLSVSQSDVGEKGNQPFIDLWFGYLNAPAVGRSILGDVGYRQLMTDLKPGEHALFVIGHGTSSFKGSAFVRGGIYDRLQISQDVDVHHFRDTDYRNLYGVRAQGVPAYTESGIFILRSASFSAAYPWTLSFLAHRSTLQGNTDFANFDADYWLPARHLDGGRPAVEAKTPGWVRIWKTRTHAIIGMIALLTFVFVFYALHRRWAARSRRTDKRRILWPHITVWLLAVVFLGFSELAQPSIVQVLTLLHSLLDGWRWDLFLSDPLIFIFWIFIAITILLWGRGVFCGWLCPYGSLSELLFKAAGKIGLKRWQFQLPYRWHQRLRWLKYVVLIVLVAASFHSMALAEQLAEIEPFKSTFFVPIWTRAWPFILFWAFLLAASMFMERPFCKYLCPLGAGLAIPSRLRLFGLWRKAECTTCKACANGCGSLAIDPQGRIDATECMQCLDCMVLYYDDKSCPPLAQERKRRERAGQPLTAVGRDGHFIPLELVE